MNTDCCQRFKEVEHVTRNAIVAIIHHQKMCQKAVQVELAKIEAALNSHKCDRIPPDVLTKDMPDFLKDLFK